MTGSCVYCTNVSLFKMVILSSCDYSVTNRTSVCLTSLEDSDHIWEDEAQKLQGTEWRRVLWHAVLSKEHACYKHELTVAALVCKGSIYGPSRGAQVCHHQLREGVAINVWQEERINLYKRPLVGSPCSTRWSHAHVHMESTNQPQPVFFKTYIN